MEIIIIISIVILILLIIWYIITHPHQPRITTVITTAPHKNMDPVRHILRTVRSLLMIPELASSPLVIGFDGAVIDHELDPKCMQSTDIEAYERYKRETMTRVSEIFPDAVFVECPTRCCLTHNLYQCMQHVATPYVYIMQHDLPIIRPFCLDASLNVLADEEYGAKCIRTVYYTNDYHEDYTSRVFHQPDLPRFSFVRDGQVFSRCNQWSDNNHITTTKYYRDVVFPRTMDRYSFMEETLLPAPIDDFETYGTYYMGAYSDGHYITHTDGRNAS